MGPEARNIAEILGVGGDLLEQPPGGFDSGEVLFALVFPAPFADQPVLAPDALNGHVADGQVELALQARGTEGGQLPSESENLLLDLGRGLPRRVMRSAAVFLQARRAVLPVSSPPLTDGEGGGEEEPCGGLDAPLPDGLDQSQAVVVGAFHFTDQIEVAGGHRAAILTARAVRLLPPPPDGAPQNPNTTLTPLAASGSHTSIPPGGNDVPFQFHSGGNFAGMAQRGHNVMSGCLRIAHKEPVKLI